MASGEINPPNSSGLISPKPLKRVISGFLHSSVIALCRSSSVSQYLVSFLFLVLFVGKGRTQNENKKIKNPFSLISELNEIKMNHSGIKD